MENTKTAAEEFARVISCDHCARNNYPKLLRNDPYNLPQPGYIGSNYKSTRVLLVGQNPGVPSDRFAAQNEEHANAQITLRDKADVRSLVNLKKNLDGTMPTWPVFQNYFPLVECGLELDDVAYINVVRCRTRDNAEPSPSILRACIENHFIRWLDWLKPKVVVCIGKLAYRNIDALLRDRDIPSDFINRQKSLSTDERQRNVQQVVSLVRGVLSGDGVDVTRQPQPTRQARTPRDRPSDNVPRRDGTLSGIRSAMEAEGYAQLFKALGIDAGNSKPNNGRVLRHTGLNISMYFNRDREVGVYFATYPHHSVSFHSHLWVTIPPDSVNNKKARYALNIVPKAGKEREAFASLLA